MLCSIDPTDKFKTTFTRLDVSDDKSYLLQFIETFDPCKNYCYQGISASTSNHDEDLNFMKKCSNYAWGDGNCDEICNSHQCQYDGGDWYVVVIFLSISITTSYILYM